MTDTNFSIDLNRARTFINNVKQEVANMKSGEGRFRGGALHFDKGTSPAMNLLTIFENTPTPDTLDAFLDICGQDFGKSCQEAFRTWAHSVFTTGELDPNFKKGPPVRTFSEGLRDRFYDAFKAAGINMTPAQMDRLNLAMVDMSKLISTEVDRLTKLELKKFEEETKNFLQEIRSSISDVLEAQNETATQMSILLEAQSRFYKAEDEVVEPIEGLMDPE